jgi:SWI/SNF-related matrix-associated actin-dependent regulator of chromatin subfamily D
MAPGLPSIYQQHPAAPMMQRPHFPPNEQQKANAQRERAQMPTDRELPDGVENMVVGDVADTYKSLKNVERRLDAAMINKRLDARDGGLRHEKRLRVMRVWVRCEAKPKSVENDTRMDGSFEFRDSGGALEYKMKIEGRLLPDLDDNDEEDDEESAPAEESMDLDKPDSDKPAKQPPVENHKFSHYFKQITVTYHPSPSASGTAPPPHPMEWKQPERARDGGHSASSEASFDALEFTPRFDGPYQKCTITLYRAEGHNRMRGKLSEPLARLLDREYEDKSGAMMGLYNYVRLKGLEEEGQPHRFRCDEPLKAVSTSSLAKQPLTK